MNTLVCEIKDEVATLTLNNPAVLNAFDLEMARNLRDIFKDLEQEKKLRCIFLKGAGSAFSSGGNIKTMIECENLPRFFSDISMLIHETVLMIRRIALPVVAVTRGVVSGVAFGLFCSCDLRLASEEATFHAGTSRIGLAANGGLTYFLPRLIGRGRASQLVLTGGTVSAELALKWGLVNEVVPKKALQALQDKWMQHLLKIPAAAHMKFKELLYEGDGDLSEHLDRERKAISETAKTDDFKKAIEDFVTRKSR
jgi:2-(1,2-epoxy-1,2-dihydrophenyl)acetyl-CoA isomerase